MEIANPIYNVVFEYLMEDHNSAKNLISAFIDKCDILSLENISPEKDTDNNSIKKLFSKIEFLVEVRSEDETKRNIKICFYKSRLGNEILLNPAYNHNISFYNEKQGMVVMPYYDTKTVSIYLLEQPLDNIKDVPILQSYTKITEQSSENGINLNSNDSFFESMNDEAYIVQIPYLKNKRQIELLKVLSIFDQSKLGKTNQVINVDEKEYPQKYHYIIKRLQQANADADLKEKMQSEMKYIENFLKKVNRN